MPPSSPDFIEVNVIALVPTSAGCAVFLGTEEKVIVFYIEPAIGASINAAMRELLPPRPLTHDLMHQMLIGFGAKVSRIAILKVEDDVFYARLIVEAENELMERKVIEFDARPSDCIALASRSKAPIYMLATVWNSLSDKSDLLNELQQQNMDQGPF